jgi:hypothetical protein
MEKLMKRLLPQYVVALSILLLATGVEASAQSRTPAVPPEADCNMPMKGDGTWVKGDIVHPGSPSMGSACTQTFNCTGAPSKKPSEACKFTLKHTDAKPVTGRCDGPSCKSCADSPPTTKCEWTLAK